MSEWLGRGRPSRLSQWPSPSLQVCRCEWHWVITMTCGGLAGNFLVVTVVIYACLEGNSCFKVSFFPLSFGLLELKYLNSSYCG